MNIVLDLLEEAERAIYEVRIAELVAELINGLSKTGVEETT